LDSRDVEVCDVGFFCCMFGCVKLLQVLCVKKILLSDEFADSIYSMRVLRLWFVKEQKNMHLGLGLGLG